MRGRFSLHVILLLLVLSLLLEAAAVLLLVAVGWANKTPWYITELISRLTTRELSPDSPRGRRAYDRMLAKFRHILVMMHARIRVEVSVGNS